MVQFNVKINQKYVDFYTNIRHTIFSTFEKRISFSYLIASLFHIVGQTIVKEVYILYYRASKPHGFGQKFGFCV